MKKWELWWTRFEFKPCDLWIGCYWKVTEYEPVQGYEIASDLDIWICIIPMIPLHLHFKESHDGDKLHTETKERL